MFWDSFQIISDAKEFTRLSKDYNQGKKVKDSAADSCFEHTNPHQCYSGLNPPQCASFT